MSNLVQLSQQTAESVYYMCQAIQALDYNQALNYHKTLVASTFVHVRNCHPSSHRRSNPDETGQFLIGLKTLIQLAQAARV